MSEAKPRWMDGFRQSTPGGSTAAATYDNDDKGQQPDPPGRWCALALLTVCTVLGMSTWFSATAVLPQLNDKWSLGTAEASLLTIAVNVGFLIGALCSVLSGLADSFSPVRMIATGSFAAAVLNAGLLVPGCQYETAVVLRFFTGAAMSIVYPLSCKVAASWFVTGRGIAMGMVLSGVTMGAAAPHLVNTVASVRWEVLVLWCSLLSALGAVLSLTCLREGAFKSERKRFRCGDIGRLMRNTEFLCASVAYLGHNWEIYAFWSWVRQFAEDSGAWQSFDSWDGDSYRSSSLVAFIAVSAGMVGCCAAGVLADRWGRTRVCLFSLLVSAACSAGLGSIRNNAAIVVVSVLWGVTVVSDSAQYSAMVSEVVDPTMLGTATTLQFGVGYISTFPSIYVVPHVQNTHDTEAGWDWAWRSLSPGPVLAAVALLVLRRLPGATKIARGKM